MFGLCAMAAFLAACAGGSAPKPGLALLTDAEAACVWEGRKSCINAWPPVELLLELLPDPKLAAEEGISMFAGSELVTWVQNTVPPPP